MGKWIFQQLLPDLWGFGPSVGSLSLSPYPVLTTSLCLRCATQVLSSWEVTIQFLLLEPDPQFIPFKRYFRIQFIPFGAFFLSRFTIQSFILIPNPCPVPGSRFTQSLLPWSSEAKLPGPDICDSEWKKKQHDILKGRNKIGIIYKEYDGVCRKIQRTYWDQ